jgi:hypothetical protein
LPPAPLGCGGHWGSERFIWGWRRRISRRYGPIAKRAFGASGVGLMGAKLGQARGSCCGAGRDRFESEKGTSDVERVSPAKKSWCSGPPHGGADWVGGETFGHTSGKNIKAPIWGSHRKSQRGGAGLFNRSSWEFFSKSKPFNQFGTLQRGCRPSAAAGLEGSAAFPGMEGGGSAVRPALAGVPVSLLGLRNPAVGTILGSGDCFRVRPTRQP